MTALADRFLFIASLLSKKYTAAPGEQTSKDRQEGSRRSYSTEDLQEGREDNNISNLSDEESSDKEPELTGNIWGPI